jgi:hypothetical protein
VPRCELPIGSSSIAVPPRGARAVARQALQEGVQLVVGGEGGATGFEAGVAKRRSARGSAPRPAARAGGTDTTRASAAAAAARAGRDGGGT